MMVASQSESLRILSSVNYERVVPPDHGGRTVTLPIRVEIDGVGVFIVDPAGITTVRPDITQADVP